MELMVRISFAFNLHLHKVVPLSNFIKEKYYEKICIMPYGNDKCAGDVGTEYLRLHGEG